MNIVQIILNIGKLEEQLLFRLLFLIIFEMFDDFKYLLQVISNHCLLPFH